MAQQKKAPTRGLAGERISHEAIPGGGLFCVSSSELVSGEASFERQPGEPSERSDGLLNAGRLFDVVVHVSVDQHVCEDDAPPDCAGVPLTQHYHHRPHKRLLRQLSAGRTR